MEPHERQLVIDQLTSSEARLLELVHGLTAPQWHFRETPDRWSIAENLEHLVVFEIFITQAITKTLEAQQSPTKRPWQPRRSPWLWDWPMAEATNLWRGKRPDRWEDGPILLS